ncbi:MAG: PIN domain-containing protein [Propionibacteriaceae bacterium]|nr:PIN domain-containing protein [Propionibacteriaceae bacterium]
MTTYLLDANVLIALMVTGHDHWERANAWAARIDRFAVCPVIEGALLRFIVRSGVAARPAKAVLDLLAARPGYQFWPDDFSYREAGLDGVIGHRQLTDAYLASLARRHDGCVLATLDQGLAQAHPDVAWLVPSGQAE